MKYTLSDHIWDKKMWSFKRGGLVKMQVVFEYKWLSLNTGGHKYRFHCNRHYGLTIVYSDTGAAPSRVRTIDNRRHSDYNITYLHFGSYIAVMQSDLLTIAHYLCFGALQWCIQL